MGSVAELVSARLNNKTAKMNYLTTKLFAEISAMNAENNQRINLSQSMAYTDDYYFAVMNEYDEKIKEIEQMNL